MITSNELAELEHIPLALPQEFPELKARLLDDAATILAVGSAPMEEMALEMIGEMKAACKGIEKYREEAKFPVLQLGRRIDELAKDAVAELESEQKRINDAVGNYRMEIRRKEQAAEASRQAEIRMKEQQAWKLKEDAAKALRDAEQAKGAKAREAAKKAAEVAIVASREAAVAARELVLETPVKTEQADAGKTTFEVRGEVTDAHALFAVRPELFDLVPKQHFVNLAAKSCFAAKKELPGLRIYEIASVRAKKPKKEEEDLPQSTIPRIAVKSSQIESIGYDSERRILAVKFSSGSVYEYQDVPQAVHSALMETESVGRFLGVHIKGKYTSTKHS